MNTLADNVRGVCFDGCLVVCKGCVEKLLPPEEVIREDEYLTEDKLQMDAHVKWYCENCGKQL
jgi:hypothetical protein